MPQTLDYYALLGCKPHASAPEVRRAWLKVGKQHHPDRYPNAAQKLQAEQRLQQINQAYEVLSDPRRRSRYDNDRNVALVPIPAKAQTVATIPAGTGQAITARNLPHRYTPGNKYVVFDGLTYMNLDEAARRLGQPADRLQMYVSNGELCAVDFDNQQWVTEASLVPLRTRHRHHEVGQAALNGKVERPWKAVVPHFGKAKGHRPPAGPAPRIGETLGSRYDASTIDRRASWLLASAPTLLLAALFGCLYCYIANFGAVREGLTAVTQLVRALG
ncbi:MAG: J domain-containing protein [bacterium]